MTIDAPTVVPAPRRGPSGGLVAAVAIMTALMVAGGALVAVRHVTSEPTEVVTSREPSCWDGSSEGAQGCPKIQGEAALKWMFRPQPDFRCEPGLPETGYGQLESWTCQWDDIDARVSLSRWDNTTSAENFYAYFLGPGKPDPGRDGLVFDSATPNGGGEPVTAFAYNAHPYTYSVTGSSSIERRRAESRLRPRSPSEIRV